MPNNISLKKINKIAQLIYINVGSFENIRLVTKKDHTLIFTYNQRALINSAALLNIKGVEKEFFANGTYHVELNENISTSVFEEFKDLAVYKDEEEVVETSLFDKFSKTLGDIFMPIIPALVATGLLIGLKSLLLTLDIITHPTILVFVDVLTEVAFMALPVFVAWSVSKRFNGTPALGILLGLILVAPQLPSGYDVAANIASPLYVNILGFNIALMGYQGSVIPALFVGIFSAKLENLIRKYTPDVLDMIVTPVITVLISATLGLLLIGPLMYGIEKSILSVFVKFITLPFGLGGLIIGGLHQVVVMTGIHHVFSALEIGLIAETGLNPFNAMITGGVIAQGAAALAVALKTKEKKQRSLNISAAIPAFLGVSEPAIFGVNLRLIKPFIFGLVGGAAGGMFAGLINLAAPGMGVTVIPGLLLYAGGNIVGFIITNVIAFSTAFILTYLFVEKQ